MGVGEEAAVVAEAEEVEVVEEEVVVVVAEGVEAGVAARDLPAGCCAGGKRRRPALSRE